MINPVCCTSCSVCQRPSHQWKRAGVMLIIRSCFCPLRLDTSINSRGRKKLMTDDINFDKKIWRPSISFESPTAISHLWKIYIIRRSSVFFSTRDFPHFILCKITVHSLLVDQRSTKRLQRRNKQNWWHNILPSELLLVKFSSIGY